MKREKQYWITADTHLGHDKIRVYCNRPFKSVQEMDDTIIMNWNQLVCKGDIVFMLGDFAFGNHEAVNNYIKKLNGSIIFVKGNHDRGLETWCKINGQKLHESYTFKIYGEEIFMAHFAHRVWHKSHYGTIHAYGHSHDMLPPLGLSMDAGVDGNNFKPHNIKDFIKRMEPIREQMIKEGLIFVNKHRK